MLTDSATSIEFSAANEAMKTALACSLAAWITYTYSWPEPYWSCMAIVVSRHASKRSSWSVLAKQSCGVALGTFIGISMLTVYQSAFLFCLLFAAWTGAVIYRCIIDPPSPLFRFAGVTATTIAMAGLFQENLEINIALIRGAEILLGTILAASVSFQSGRKGDSQRQFSAALKLPRQQLDRLARQQAGRVVLAMLTTLGIWLSLDIPSGPFAVLAVTSSLIATSATDSAAVKFYQRLLGVALGMGLAIAFTLAFLPQMERIPEFELFIFGIFWICSFINYASERFAFVGLQSSSTFAIVLMRDAHQSPDLLAIWQRGRALVLGLVITFVVMDLLTQRSVRSPRLRTSD